MKNQVYGDQKVSDNITWVDFARIFVPNITEEEVKEILMEHTAYPFGGFHHNARLMKEYLEEAKSKR